MDAELVLDRMRAHVVALAERAVGVEQKLRHEEQRNAARSGGRVGQPRQHEMHDVVGHVVLAVGDEDLLPGQAIAAVAGALGPGAQRADVGARLRLGQLHGAGPFAGHELRQIGALEFIGAVGGQRVDPGHRQHRPDAESHGGRIPHLEAGDVDRLRQVLPAEVRRGGEPVPARRGPGAIGFLPARRGGDGAILEDHALAVADHIERAEHLGRELAGFFQHGVDHVLGEVAVDAVVQRLLESGGVLERKRDVGNRSPVGHLTPPCGSRRPRSSRPGPELPGSRLGENGGKNHHDPARAALIGRGPAAMVRARRRPARRHTHTRRDGA